MSGDQTRGVVLPTSGPMATRDTIVSVATAAEELGYGSVWVFHRLLYPVNYSNEHPFLRPGGRWPVVFESVLDPLQSLALAGAHTSRVRLATGVINLPYYTPVVLAKELASLDVLSGGRVDAGVGIGWSVDELAAVGVDPARRGARGDEFIRFLRAIWSDDEVELEGEFYRVPRSRIEPKPVQRPGPPLLIGGYSEAALRRAVRLGDGYVAGAVPFDRLSELLDRLAALRADAHSDGPYRIVSRVEAPMGDPARRSPVQAVVEALAAALERYRGLGVTDVYLDFNQTLAAADDGPAALEEMLLVLHALAPDGSPSPPAESADRG